MIEKQSDPPDAEREESLILLPNPAGQVPKNPVDTVGQVKTDDGGAKVLLPLSDAAARLSITKRQMLRLARLCDVAHVEIDGEFFFRPSALAEWAKRNEHKAWDSR